MERQIERRRESEPVVYTRTIEELWARLKAEEDKAASLPHVVRYKDIQWTQNAQTYIKHYSGLIGFPGRLTEVPICTLDLVEQMVFARGRSGKHRHYMEAFFYIIEGSGYEIHDNVKYPWEAGDVMCVPTYCVHQHFNPDSEKPARLFFSVPIVFELMGLASIEQIEMHENYQPPEGTTALRGPQGEIIGYKKPDGTELRFGAVDLEFQHMMEAKRATQFDREPRNTYEHYLRALTDQIRWRQSIPHVVKGKERPWEDTQMGRLKYLLSSYIPSPLLLYDCYIQEIPPGGRSGKHRHVGEEVHKILEGKGYDIHNGRKWDWDTEDVVIIPNNTTHQHFNADPKRPARFMAIQSRLYHYVGHGGIEHLEDAPEYKG